MRVSKVELEGHVMWIEDENPTHKVVLLSALVIERDEGGGWTQPGVKLFTTCDCSYPSPGWAGLPTRHASGCRQQDRKVLVVNMDALEAAAKGET